MRYMLASCWILMAGANGFCQKPEPPIDETRLSIHTLVREDIFAGWRANNMERLERGARNVDLLLEKRPGDKADLLAWKGGVAVYRAVLAYEQDRAEESRDLYKQALELFEQSKQASDSSVGAASVIGGSLGMFADRLPPEVQESAWQMSYDSYQKLYMMQADIVDRMPTHMRGELLAGLAQSAQRTGRSQAYEDYLNQIIEKLPNTGYSRVAKQWKDEPAAARTGNISCKTCHAPGRLAVRLAKLP